MTKLNFGNAEFITSFGNYSQISPSEMPEIAFSGHSNVGKSTLINKIFSRKKLARVSATPGKTATVNIFSFDKGYTAADLPGYGYAKVSKAEKDRWTKLLRAYLESDRNIALVIQLVDIRHKPTADDIKMIEFLIETEQPFMLVFTKKDKCNQSELRARREAFKTEIPCYEDIIKVEFSAVTGEGIDEIKVLIAESVEAEIADAPVISANSENSESSQGN
jgi:GTP-binding protein